MSEEDEAERHPAKSVPPHVPPTPRVATYESDLPSVIVDLAELEASARLEAASDLIEVQRTSDVDGLLAATDALPDMRRREATLPSIDRGLPRKRGAARGFVLGLLAAVAIGGGGLGAFVHLTHHLPFIP